GDFGSSSLLNVTVSANQAVGGSSSSVGTATAGGIYDDTASPVQMKNTIISGNTSTTDPDVFGIFFSLGHNLISDTTGGSGFVASDLKNQTALLAPLDFYGGPTQTMNELAGSPTLGAGDTSGVTQPTDQRGFPRIVAGKIDIGAVEHQASEA